MYSALELLDYVITSHMFRYSLTLVNYFAYMHRVSKFDVYSVYTIGDQFMVVSGMPKLNGKNKFLSLIASHILIFKI
jgi:hypothetical protein